MDKNSHAHNESGLRIRSIAVVAVMLVAMLGILVGPIITNVSAAPDTHTWDGGGADAFAGTSANWDTDVAPEAGDSVIFNAGASPCTWNLTIILNSFNMNAGYTGTITVSANFGTTGNVTISSGTIDLATHSIYVGKQWYSYYGNTTFGTSTIYMQTAGYQFSVNSAARPYKLYLNATSGVYTLGGTMTLSVAAGSGVIGNGAILYLGGNALLSQISTTQHPLSGSGTIISIKGLGYISSGIATNPATISYANWEVYSDVRLYSTNVDNYVGRLSSDLDLHNYSLKVYGGAVNQNLIFNTYGYDISLHDFFVAAYGKAYLTNSTVTCTGWFDTTNATEFAANSSRVIMTGGEYLKIPSNQSLYDLTIDSQTRLGSNLDVSGSLVLNATIEQNGYELNLTATRAVVSADAYFNQTIASASGFSLNVGSYFLSATPSTGTISFSNISFQNQITTMSTTSTMIVQPTDVIVGIGDSMMSTVFTNQLSNKTGVTVVNKGVGGEESDLIYARFEADVIALNPQYVVILAGFNDFLYGLTVTQTEGCLRGMYDKAIDNGTQVIACTIAPYISWNFTLQTNHEEINQWIEAQATTNIRVVDLCSLIGTPSIPQQLNPTYAFGDWIHPNTLGYNLMANYTVEQCFVNQSVVYGTESSVARWTIEGSSPVTFTVSGLNSEVGYKVYVDGVEIYQQFKGQTSLAFSYSGPWSEHTFEVVAWDYTPGTEIQAAYEYTIDGNMVTFTDKSYGGATVWIWNFGDGVGSTKQSPTHQYQASGTYTVSLTVYDAKGHSSTAKTQIKITLGPDFPLEPSPGGWNVYISDKITLSISAVGLLIGGLIMYVSAIFIPSIPIITPRGRKVIGALMVIAGLYFLVIKDNSWMHF